MENRVGPDAELLGHVARKARAEIARARADEEGVQIRRDEACLVQSVAQGPARKGWRLGAERVVQLVRGAVEDAGDVGHREVPLPDAVLPQEDAP